MQTKLILAAVVLFATHVIAQEPARPESAPTSRPTNEWRTETDADRVPSPPGVGRALHALHPTSAARALGNPRVANVIALGALVGLSGLCAFETLESVVATSTPPKFRDLNIAALREGRKLAL